MNVRDVRPFGVGIVFVRVSRFQRGERHRGVEVCPPPVIGEFLQVDGWVVRALFGDLCLVLLFVFVRLVRVGMDLSARLPIDAVLINVCSRHPLVFFNPWNRVVGWLLVLVGLVGLRAPYRVDKFCPVIDSYKGYVINRMVIIRWDRLLGSSVFMNGYSVITLASEVNARRGRADGHILVVRSYGFVFFLLCCLYYVVLGSHGVRVVGWLGGVGRVFFVWSYWWVRSSCTPGLLFWARGGVGGSISAFGVRCLPVTLSVGGSDCLSGQGRLVAGVGSLPLCR